MTCMKVLAILTAVLIFADTVQWVHGSKGIPSTTGKSPLMIKVVDGVRGIPAPKLSVKLYRQQKDDKSWDLLFSNVTSEEGEIHNFITEEEFVEGIYRMELVTKNFWIKLGLTPFHEYIDVVFTANDAGHRHYTIAMLVTPYSFSSTAVVTGPLEDHK